MLQLKLIYLTLFLFLKPLLVEKQNIIKSSNDSFALKDDLSLDFLSLHLKKRKMLQIIKLQHYEMMGILGELSFCASTVAFRGDRPVLSKSGGSLCLDSVLHTSTAIQNIDNLNSDSKDKNKFIVMRLNKDLGKMFNYFEELRRFGVLMSEEFKDSTKLRESAFENALKICVNLFGKKHSAYQNICRLMNS
ncbi:hypothetical protein RFI_23046 [Reticulomyxa filosa]|uniref:Uncharacterized protein n=1 Tax=Reticulomyxa filosa TaxID=46433 RepID=X6MJY6_RETFI|nr:hypothetical protein RFI_23046 [Reticulomyxa filosa]|eukprot:ETO14323.1 hypothetical protein RFI_23046 [Reticulomyxa filosa]